MKEVDWDFNCDAVLSIGQNGEKFYISYFPLL